MSTPGIIITQPGIDVKTAADYQMIFNSSWPSLQIAYEANIVVGPLTSAQTAHSLGFFPLTMGWLILNGISIGRIFGSSGNLAFPQTDVILSFDKTNVYLTNNNSTATYTVSIKCYNLDISKSIDYTLPLAASFKLPYDSTYGIKVAKSNKAITSTDLRDFILHSRAQSPAVLSIVTKPTVYTTGIPYAIQYTNPVGYVPWVLAFIGNNNGTKYSPLAQGSQQSGYLFTTIASTATSGSISALSRAFNPSSAIASLVVLRDPLVVSTNLNVRY